jgi:hypothetical protein
MRGLLAGTLAQARFTDEVSRLMHLREVNETPTSRLGGMLRAQAWWSKSLDPELLMRAAACSYRDQLKALRLHPGPADMAVAQSVEVELESRDTPLPTVQAVMGALRTSDGVRSPLLDNFATAAPQSFDATVLVRTSPEQAMFLNEVLGLPERPATLEVYRACYRRLQGLLVHLR